MRAYPRGPAQKSAALDRLADAARSGRFAVSNDALSIGLLACVAESADPRVVEQVAGIPGSLALLADESVRMLSKDPAAARAFAYEWIDAPRAGADLSSVPGATVLWLFKNAAAPDVLPPGSQMPAVFVEVRDLHARAAAGEAVDRTAWATARANAIAATDEAPIEEGTLMTRLAETLAWPPHTSRAILIEAARVYADICSVAKQKGSGVTAREDAAIRRAMDALFAETSTEREANPEAYSFPDIFAARYPDMSARFVERLEAGNAAYEEAFIACARHSVALMRSAPAT